MSVWSLTMGAATIVSTSLGATSARVGRGFSWAERTTGRVRTLTSARWTPHNAITAVSTPLGPSIVTVTLATPWSPMASHALVRRGTFLRFKLLRMFSTPIFWVWALISSLGSLYLKPFAWKWACSVKKTSFFLCFSESVRTWEFWNYKNMRIVKHEGKASTHKTLGRWRLKPSN